MRSRSLLKANGAPAGEVTAAWKAEFAAGMERRRRAAAQASLVTAAAVVTFVGGGVLLWLSGALAGAAPPALFAVGAVVLLAVVVAAVLSAGRSGEYAAYFEAGRARVAAALDPGGVFEPDGAIPEAEWDAALFPFGEYNGYHGANYVRTRLAGGLGAEVCGLKVTHTYTETTTVMVNGKPTTQTRTKTDVKFSGTFMRLDLGRRVNGHFVVEPRRSGRRRGYNRCLLANPDFEEVFEVQATDQQSAFYMLPPATQARVLAWAQSLGAAPHLSYRPGVVAIAVPRLEVPFGEKPGLLRPIAAGWPDQLAADMGESYAFVRRTAEALDVSGDYDEEPLT